MEELMSFAKESFKNGEYHYNAETNDVIVLLDKGKYVFRVYRDTNDEVTYMCLNEPMN